MATTLFSIILFIHFHRNGLVLGLTEFFFFFLICKIIQTSVFILTFYLVFLVSGIFTLRKFDAEIEYKEYYQETSTKSTEQEEEEEEPEGEEEGELTKEKVKQKSKESKEKVKDAKRAQKAHEKAERKRLCFFSSLFS